MRIVSNQIPALAELTTSCLVNSTRWSWLSPCHSAVPYRLLRCGGIQNAPGTNGASQSISTVGSYELRSEDLRSRSAVCSRVAVMGEPPGIDVPRSNCYEWYRATGNDGRQPLRPPRQRWRRAAHPLGGPP